MRKLKILLCSILTMPICMGFANGQIAFDIKTTQTCVSGKQGADRLECASKAANACMKIPEGSFTNVMKYCLSKEIEWWDSNLNIAYKQLLKLEQAEDAELESSNSIVLKQETALRNMQLSWIEYRDRLCDYEASQWNGGTIAGVAYLSCKMNETARQYLVIQNRIEVGKER